MSDTVVVKKKEAGPVQLVVTLFLISAICAVLLGLVNNITAGPIAAANEAATNAAMQAVLPADSYEQVEYTDGTCTGVSIISHAETSGLGANATKEDFRAQFVGKANVAVTKDGGDIAALTGATITSRAVCDGVNAAIEAAASVG